jgi:hypothetical protein
MHDARHPHRMHQHGRAEIGWQENRPSWPSGPNCATPS